MNGSKDLRRKAEALARENASKAPEQHGGKAWVESAKEPWTTFHVSISKNL